MQDKFLIYKVKFSLFDAIYKGDTHQTFKKIMDSRLSDVQRLIKNWKKSDLFAAHYDQHLKYTDSRTYLRTCMVFKVVNQLNPIGEMK